MGARARGWVAANGGTVLGELSVAPRTPVVVGVPFVGDIGGATAGSLITVPDLPVGLTLDSAARTISGTLSEGGTYTFSMIETLAGVANSPRTSAKAIIVDPAPEAVPYPASGRRKSVGLAALTQSVELGSVRDEERAANPLAWRSARNPAFAVPIAPAKGRQNRGGFWCAVYDDLWDHGYDLRVLNCGAGGLSLTRGAAGQVGFRQNSFGYSQFRLPAGGADRGYFGDTIVSPLNDGSLWRCTTGRSTAAFGDGPFKVNGAETNLDYVETTGTQATAASAPTFPAPTLGATVTDGTIVWTCIATSGFTGGQVLNEDSHKGFGFDPYGLLARLHEEMGRLTDVERKIVYLSDAQSELSTGATTYSSVLQSIANYFLTRGYEVMIGLSTFYPRATTASYDALQTGRASALAALKANATYGGKVFDGANLYAAMGSTGAMGGWRGTGSISAGVLTVTSSIGARSPAAGQQIVLEGSINGVVVATITSVGTYNPATGTGTINVSGADRASTGMIALGEFYDLKDQTHLNARGNIGPALNQTRPIRTHVSRALKAVLTR